MKILLVVTNSRRKNLVFASDSFKMLSLEETLTKATSASFDNLFVVKGSYGGYLRSVPNNSEKDNLDTISVTAADIIAYANRTRHFNSTDAISRYTAEFYASVIESGKPYLLGAILIDEIVRMVPFEEVWDKFLLKLLGRNVSVGVAQVKLETANGLIKRGLYNPNPNDAKLPFSGNLRQIDREHLYGYVMQPKHNIRFAAARIRDLIKGWSIYIDISGMPEILGTLYHRSYVSPHAHPIPNKRGSQIAEEFYALATRWLRS